MHTPKDHPDASRPPMRTGRWLIVYFLLAGFDIAAVSISLYLNHLIVSRYAESIEVNRDWADRQGIYANLGQLAAAVNTPGNDVFATGDISGEEAELDTRAEDFRVRLREARRDLIIDIDPTDAEPLLNLLDRAATEMDEAVSTGHEIFAALGGGDPTSAGEHMAAMDRAYNRARDYLTELDARVRLIQRRALDTESAAAADLRLFEFLIGGFIVVMVLGVTLYGHLLVQQARRASRQRERIEAELARHRDHLEQLVEERTAELEASYAQLRTSERLASIGTLAAGLGHDMKNLLFPMRCRLDVVQTLDLPGDAREELDSVRASLEYLQRLSRGLRLLSLDPADAEASDETTRITDWWGEVGGLVERSLPAEAHFTAEISDDTPPASVPPHLLTQAVLNLVVNAGEALTGPGEVRLTIERAHDAVVVRVSDTGNGMTPDVRERVLDPFFTTKRRGLSTGLGLSLVHAVVRAADGEIDIDSAPGRGAVFTLTLPIAGVDAVTDDAAPPTTATPIEHAVVTLDDPRLASFASAVLTAAGTRVERAESLNGFTSPSLWVTDTLSHTGSDDAARFLADDPRNRIVALGAPVHDTRLGPRVVHLDTRSGADHVRGALLDALHRDPPPNPGTSI